MTVFLLSFWLLLCSYSLELTQSKILHGAPLTLVAYFNDDLIDGNNAMIVKLRSKLIKGNIPIFEFRKEAEEILSHGADLSELVVVELIFNDYMILLREYYFELFTSKSARTSPQEINVIRESILEECRRYIFQSRFADWL